MYIPFDQATNALMVDVRIKPSIDFTLTSTGCTTTTVNLHNDSQY